MLQVIVKIDQMKYSKNQNININININNNYKILKIPNSNDFSLDH